MSIREAMKEAQEAPIEYIAFSGGGAKGAMYSGVYSALKERGVFNNVKAVAGSSAGAITATLAATAISPIKFEQISKNTNLQSLLGEQGFSKPVPINKDGKPLYDLLDNTIRENIQDFLQRENIIATADDRVNELITRCQNKGKIYFKDLALLREHNPEQFKDLVITAVGKNDGKLKIFSSFNTPDIEIALACRASASIPGVFQPVMIEGDLYVDGGCMDNVPTKYFPENQPEFELKDLTEDMKELKLVKKQSRTLAMAFGTDMSADANIAVYSAKKLDNLNAIIKFLIDVVYITLVKTTGNFKYTKSFIATNEELRANALNTVVLSPKGVGTLDFKDAQIYADYLHMKGYYQTREYLKNHELEKEPSRNLEYQNFLLSIYEIYDNENLNKNFTTKLWDMIIDQNSQISSKWRNMVGKNHDRKAKALLSFCVPAAPARDLTLQLQKYIMVTALYRENVFKTDTNAMKALIYGLNDNATPNKIKEKFIDLLSVNKNNDNRFDPSKTEEQNIAQFKFSKEDFQSFIGANKNIVIKIPKASGRDRKRG